MSLILNIDTAAELGNISIALDGSILCHSKNPHPKTHAGWLHIAIEDLLVESRLTMKDIQAIAVTDGPGSYTGLRVALSAAKGFCFTLNIPLITINSLFLMAYTASNQYRGDQALYYCPMIDARRMEVFAAIYNRDLKEIIPPQAMILDENALAENIENNDVVFFGSGAEKFKTLQKSKNIRVTEMQFSPDFLGILAFQKFETSQFTDIIYSEPAYTKEFYTHTKK